jgi:hypothetical protein
MYPKERISDDFNALAEILVGTPPAQTAGVTPGLKAGFRLFGRAKESARA